MERIDLDTWPAKEVARLLTLVENEKRYYQELIALVPVGLAVVSRDLSVLSVNRAFRRLFELSYAAASRKRLDDLLPPELVSGPVPQAIATGAAPEPKLFTITRSDGTSRLLRLSIIPLYGWQEESSGDALIVLEEPDRREAAPHDWLEALPGAVWRLDAATGQIRFANRWAEKLLGPEAEKAWPNRVHPEDAARLAWVYEAVLESGRPASIDYRIRDAQGKIHWLCDQIEPIPGAEQKIAALQVLTTEISGRRQAAANLIRTKKMEGLGRLAGRFAHDCNNLLMIIEGYGEELRERLAGDEESRQALEQILKGAERLRVLSSDLMKLRRLPAPQTRTLDLNAFLSGLSLAASLDLSGQAEPVAADPAQLEEALRTLVAFASESAPDRAVRISTKREMLLSDYGDGVRGPCVTVQLGPVAVNAELLDRWSEPFSSGTAKAGGLGLALVSRTLEHLGARIELVQIDEGLGAFLIRLPLAALAEPQPAEAPKAPPPAPPPPKLETVLVVDDEEGIRSLVKRILERHGYRVLEAGSSEEALRVSESFPGPIHIAVSDVMLPQMQGPELVSTLRRKRPQMRALYISGYTDDPALGSGALPVGEGFLAKPFTIAALLASVRSVLDAV